jgi:ABC-type lipoprotein export system ATPase subunit
VEDESGVLISTCDRAERPLEVIGVSRSFVSAAETVWAVRNVSLAADAGELVLVSGASGSGKSTLVNLIAGLDRPDAGQIFVDGAEVTKLDEAGATRLRLERVGVVFQEHRLIEEFTAAENVALPLQARGATQRDALAEAARLLRRVGLDGFGHRRPDQLSGGQRQRVGIARALAGERCMILADEPTGSLDSATSLEVFELLRELCEHGLVVVLCSHDPRARRFADRHFEMVDGALSRALVET